MQHKESYFKLSPYCDLDPEDSKTILSNNTLTDDDTKPYAFGYKSLNYSNDTMWYHSLKFWTFAVSSTFNRA